MASFEELMEGLSEKVNRDLQIDKNGRVVLRIKDQINIQFEVDKTREEILIAAFVEELPPGKFREHILRDALKANSLYPEKHSILSYMQKENYLMIHQKFSMDQVTFEKFYESIQNISLRAFSWYEAIDNGRSCPDEEITTTESSKGSIFGIQ